MGKSICFAYFGDGKFLGWYADSFGGIRENSPKVYGDSKSQLETITSNFRCKVEQARKYEKLAMETVIGNYNAVGGALLSVALRDDETKIVECEHLELRIVECPFYDGPNPFFSRKVDKKSRKNHTKLYHKWCKEFGLDAGIKPNTILGIGLIDNYKKFEKAHPRGDGKWWVYVDYKKVKEWASNEPTEFLGTITTE